MRIASMNLRLHVYWLDSVTDVCNYVRYDSCSITSTEVERSMKHLKRMDYRKPFVHIFIKPRR